MVRQNHIEIDSDSSESKSHLLPWNTNTLPLPSKEHKEKLAVEVASSYKFKKSTMEPLTKIKKEDVKLKEKSSRHRKYSIGVQNDKLLNTKVCNYLSFKKKELLCT